MRFLHKEIESLLAEHADSSLAAPAARQMLASKLAGLMRASLVVYLGYTDSWMALFNSDGSIIEEGHDVDVGRAMARLGYVTIKHLKSAWFEDMIKRYGKVIPIENIEAWVLESDND